MAKPARWKMLVPNPRRRDPHPGYVSPAQAGLGTCCGLVRGSAFLAFDGQKQRGLRQRVPCHDHTYRLISVRDVGDREVELIQADEAWSQALVAHVIDICAPDAHRKRARNLI